jgi:hypothetical protein
MPPTPIPLGATAEGGATAVGIKTWGAACDTETDDDLGAAEAPATLVVIRRTNDTRIAAITFFMINPPAFQK